MISPPAASSASAVCLSSSFIARCKLVSPFGRCSLMLAPCCTRQSKSASGTFFAVEAHSSGVMLFQSRRCGSAPFSSKTFTTPGRFTDAAQCSGVRPWLSWKFGSAPASSSNSTATTAPFTAPQCSGVRRYIPTYPCSPTQFGSAPFLSSFRTIPILFAAAASCSGVSATSPPHLSSSFATGMLPRRYASCSTVSVFMRPGSGISRWLAPASSRSLTISGLSATKSGGMRSDQYDDLLFRLGSAPWSSSHRTTLIRPMATAQWSGVMSVDLKIDAAALSSSCAGFEITDLAKCQNRSPVLKRRRAILS